MYILSISVQLLSLISGVGVVQGIFLAVLLYFHPRSDRKVNFWLALYIVFLTGIMAGPLIMRYVPWQEAWYITPLSFMPGILMYYYIRSFKEKITFRKTWYWLLFFIVMNIVQYLYLDYLGGKYPHSKTVPEEVFRTPVAYFIFLTRYALLFTFYFLSRRELNLYQRSIKHVFSETSRIDMNWVRLLINGYLVIVICSVIIYFLMTKYVDQFYLMYLINIAIATPYLYGISYKGLTQPTIWQKAHTSEKQLEEQMHESEEIVKTNREKTKTPKPVATDNRLDEIVKNTVVLMENERLYQETELTLQELSDKLQSPPHLVSQALNEVMQKSFYDLVNSYRVEEAKRLLVDPKNLNYTILSVGFEAGFNSKTTFNTVFKKFTGLTPTEYKEKTASHINYTLQG
jgi:AraC-like DNA-binding protein